MAGISCTNEMYCLANMCYVCLEKKDKLLSNINNLMSVNKDIIHILDYLPFNLAWLKTLQIILICDECCLHLRDTCQYMEKCLKNSALLRAYMAKLNTTPMSNTTNATELLIKLNITHKDINEIQSEDDEIYTFQWQPNIEEIGDVFIDFEDSLVKEGIICKNEVDDKQEYPTDNNSTEIIEEAEDVSVDFDDSLVNGGIVCKKEVDDMQDNNSTEIIEETEDVFVNLEDYFVKEENSWKREEVDNVDEHPTDNNSTENIDYESDSEISVNDNAHLTNTDCATNKNVLNTAAKKIHKCSSCSKSFITKSELNIHTQIHTEKKSYECAICQKRFSQKGHLVVHMRIHTGEKPYNCTRCKKFFNAQTNLTHHMRIHTGEKPYKCSNCKICFAHQSSLLRHMRVHSGEKPYECSTCKKCFRAQGNLVRHIRVHTGEKPYECAICKKRFTVRSHLVRHMRVHTSEKPHEYKNVLLSVHA